MPHPIVADQFSLETENLKNGYLEIIFSSSMKADGQSVVFDATLLKGNSAGYISYLAKLNAEPDENAQVGKLPAYSDRKVTANMLQASHMGQRAETIFGLSMLHDVALITTRGLGSATSNNVVYDTVLIVNSTLGLQKRLLSEIFSKLKAYDS